MRSFPLQRCNAVHVCAVFTILLIVCVPLTKHLHSVYFGDTPVPAILLPERPIEPPERPTDTVPRASVEPTRVLPTADVATTTAITFARHHLNTHCPLPPPDRVLHETVPHVAGCKPEQMIAGTQLAQYELWRHQNPETCNGKKFLVAITETGETNGADRQGKTLPGRGRGIGSLIQVAALNLLFAKRNNRILVFDPKHDTNWASAPLCSSPNMFLCHFLPISNCTVSQADIDSARDFPTVVPQGRGSCTRFGKCLRADRVLKTTKTFGYRYQDMFLVPEIGPLYAGELHASTCAYVSPQKIIYWAAMQAMAYLTRLQNNTLTAIREYSKSAFDDELIAARTVSVHLRFGDKNREVSLPSEKNYVLLANSLATNFSAYFVSTEDQGALEAVQHSMARPVSFVRAKRTNRTDPAQILTALARSGNASDMFVDAWLNLLLAIQCDAFVGILSSSWNRLLDGMRSTVGCKAQAAYYDPTSRKMWVQRKFRNAGGQFFWGEGTHAME